MSGSLFGGLAQEVARYRNRHFLKAAMAAAALAANADGTVRLSERYEIDGMLERLDALSLYDPEKAVAILDDYLAALRTEPGPARTVLLNKLARVADDPDAARLIVAIAHAVTEADGEISGAERAQLDEIRSVLGQA